MAPSPSNRRPEAAAEPQSDFDWKVLIDNGQAQVDRSAANNRTISTAEPLEQPFPSRAPAVASNLIPLYCGLLGALICGLVLWIVLKHARRRGRDSKLQPPHPHAADVTAPLTETAPEGVELDGDSGDALTLALLPETQRKKLEQALNSQDGWKALAAEMGFDAGAVSELESVAKRDSASPAGLLLSRFSETADSAATVGELRRLLTTAGLSDAFRTCQRQPRGDSATGTERQKRRRHRPADCGTNVSSCEAVELTTV